MWEDFSHSPHSLLPFNFQHPGSTFNLSAVCHVFWPDSKLSIDLTVRVPSLSRWIGVVIFREFFYAVTSSGLSGWSLP